MKNNIFNFMFFLVFLGSLTLNAGTRDPASDEGGLPHSQQSPFKRSQRDLSPEPQGELEEDSSSIKRRNDKCQDMGSSSPSLADFNFSEQEGVPHTNFSSAQPFFSLLETLYLSPGIKFLISLMTHPL